jgi:hypothetical protein
MKKDKKQEVETKTGSFIWASGSKYGILRLTEMENIGRNQMVQYTVMDKASIAAVKLKQSTRDLGKWIKCAERVLVSNEAN